MTTYRIERKWTEAEDGRQRGTLNDLGQKGSTRGWHGISRWRFQASAEYALRDLVAAHPDHEYRIREE